MPATQDYLFAGQGFGEFGQHFARSGFDQNLYRPFIDGRGQLSCIVNMGSIANPKLEKHSVKDLRDAGFPVVNAATTLRKDDWIRFDNRLREVAKPRLRAWTDLAGASSMSGFDGYSAYTHEREAISSGGRAYVDMDGMTEGQGDNPLFLLDSTPLPITHSSFWMPKRTIEVSRAKGTPLSTRQLTSCTERVTETVERTLIGTLTGMTFGTDSRHRRDSRVWGYLNFPDRMTLNTMTTPNSGGWTGNTLVTEVLTMIDNLAATGKYGPFMLYHSTDFSQIMGNDYSYTGGNHSHMTVAQRLRGIDEIRDVRRLDFLPAATNPWTIVLVEMSENTAVAIEGMPLRVLQWESHGGEKIHFKVMTIMVPELASDYNGSCGIGVMTTS